MHELTTQRQRPREVPAATRAKGAGRSDAKAKPDRSTPATVSTPTLAKVLVACDGTASSAKALSFACELARRQHAELHVLGTVQVLEVADERTTATRIERARRQCERLVRGLKTEPAGNTLVPHVEIAMGAAADQILIYAERNHVGHIVIGHRRRGRFSDWLFSVAREVITFAPCTVTVIRA